jgi:hypothetical protein
MIRLGTGKQQERCRLPVSEQVHTQLRLLVLRPVIGLECHQRPAGPVVQQPVDVERGDDLVVEVLQQVLGEQSSRRSRVDEAVKVDEERGAVHIAKGWFQLVEVLWLPLHTHSL